jgi:hypothetical protein
VTVVQAPPVLYVGDAGQLIVTLDGGKVFNQGKALTVDNPAQLAGLSPSSNLVIEKLSVAGKTLTLDFRAYAPGNYQLEGLPFLNQKAGLNVKVASILEQNPGTNFAGLEAPLTPPAVMPLLYGSFFSLAFVAALAVVMPRWGLPSWRKWRAKRRRRRKLLSFERELLSLKDMPAAVLAEKLNVGLRDLLGFLSGRECKALTPLEFAALAEVLPGALPQTPQTDFYQDVFRRCDALRFGPEKQQNREAAAALLEKVRSWLEGLSPLRGHNDF